jgi:hypothetical protein
MTTPDPTDAAERLLAQLPALFGAEIASRGISLRAAAAELAISPSSAVRIARGDGMDAQAFVKLVRWLRLGPSWFASPGAPDAYRRGRDAAIAQACAAWGIRTDDDPEQEARCATCGCTEDAPCAAGCAWLPVDGLHTDLCSACALLIHQALGAALILPPARHPLDDDQAPAADPAAAP